MVRVQVTVEKISVTDVVNSRSIKNILRERGHTGACLLKMEADYSIATHEVIRRMPLCRCRDAELTLED